MMKPVTKTISFAVLLLSMNCCVFGVNSAAAQEPEEKPNIILINLDDADVDLLNQQSLASYFPNIQQLAQEGIRFTNFHITTPLCGPSRACLLRGQYAHKTGIKANSTGSVSSVYNGYVGGLAEYVRRGHDQFDLPVWMKSLGYETALIGKYVNSGAPTYVPPGWDHFYCSLGGRYYTTSRFTNQTDPNGSRHSIPEGEYRTDVETEDCLRLLTERYQTQSDQPFFYYLAPFAPHLQSAGSGEMYDLDFADQFPGIKLPRSPDFNELSFSDKPSHLQQLNQLTQEQIDETDKQYRWRVLSMLSIDDMVRRIRERLYATGELDNTYIILTSDNGYQMGHHRLLGKNDAFNRTTNVPLIVWGPGVPSVSEARHLLANIDLAPTIVELAGGTAPSIVDGVSFKQLIEDPSSVSEPGWRFGILIENWEDRFVYNQRLDGSYTALRMFDETYTEWSNGEREYYNLAVDPFQLNNAIDSLSDVEKNIFRVAMREIKWNPQTAIAIVNSNPTKKVVNKDFAVIGLAEHRFGISEMRVAVRDLESGMFWNGETWQQSHFANVVQPKSVDGQITDWRFPLGVDDMQSDFARLVFSTRAVDTDGVVGGPAVYRINMDTAAPESTVRFPRNGVVTRSPLRITGNAIDRSPIREIRLVIKDIDRQLFFDGSDWVSSRRTIVVPPKTPRFWEHTLNLPAGRYWMSARAYDTAGNYDRSPFSLTFRIK